MNRFLLAFLLLLLTPALAVPAHAQESLRDDPGHVDFQVIERWFDAPPTLVVNISKPLLDLVAEAADEEDAGATSVINRIEAIQVRGYDLEPGQFDGVLQQANALIQRLEARGWMTVVRVREEGEAVGVQVRMQDDAITGLVVMTIDPESGEAIFVNIVGNIQPEDLDQLGQQFDINALKDMGDDENDGQAP